MEAICSSEISGFLRTWLHYNPEGRMLYTHSCSNLNSEISNQSFPVNADITDQQFIFIIGNMLHMKNWLQIINICLIYAQYLL
jgi:hypothetical protein